MILLIFQIFIDKVYLVLKILKKLKVSVAAKKLKEINPLTKIKTYKSRT